MKQTDNLQFTDEKLFPCINNLPQQHQTQILVSQIVKLQPNSLNRYDRTQHIVLKEFIYDTISTERRKFQLQELEKVYFHIPLSLYDPSPFDYEFKLTLSLPERWSYAVHDLSTSTFQAFRSTSGPGCQHRVCACELKCNICDDFFGCKFCHNELELDHEFPYLQTDTIKCRFCSKIQKFGIKCDSCGVQFGLDKASCLTCRRLDFQDQNTQPFVHCDSCEKCYIGLESEIVHCTTCEICFKGASAQRHICQQELVCNACLGPIKNQHLAYTVPPCGHVIHDPCKLQMMASGSYACPICRKLIVEDESRFLLLEHQKRVFSYYYILRFNRRIGCFSCNECGAKFRQKVVGFNFCKACGTCNVGEVEEGDFQSFDFSQCQIVKVFINTFWGKNYQYFDEICVESGLDGVAFQDAVWIFVKNNNFEGIKNITFSEFMNIFKEQ
ncbi:CHY zinc finger domain-containing protein [Spironucleus salmonicida]|uniref:CHY zinc finger domain-containing protein n=1 Tax=Spironucleus salmonicida TaxID=348837 RepID=V6LVJ0_9EUKA|nr:CHY zinc finger domain-containing protein [Spironucleus salmonicida]|eukprot:EST48253.1 CHY zinc finger domain-containing protein [Spironucleus salmonicida]